MNLPEVLLTSSTNPRRSFLQTGEFYDYQADADEKYDLASTTRDTDLITMNATLQVALDQFQNACPAGLDRQFEKSGKRKAKKTPKVNLLPKKL